MAEENDKKVFTKMAGRPSEPDSAASALSKVIDRLERDLLDSKEGRREERFVFVVVILLFFNAFLLEDINTLGAALLILVPEVVVILVLANRLGIDVIFTWLRNLLNYKRPSGDGD